MVEDYRATIDLISSGRSLPDVYAASHVILSRRMPADSMYVCLKEQGGMRFPYYVDEMDPSDSFTLHPVRGLTGFVLTEGKRYWMSRDEPPPQGFEPIGAIPSDWIGLPMLDARGEAFGVLTVQTYEAGRVYVDADAEFLACMATALSAAIRMARLERDLAISRIASFVEDTVDVADLYRMLHDTIAGIIPAARRNFIIARVDETAGAFRSVYWVDEMDADLYRTWPLDRGFTGYIYSVSRKPLVYIDGATELPREWPLFGTKPLYFLGAPLFVNETMLGIIAIQSYDHGRPITREDERALEAVSRYVAQAICRTELLGKFRL